MEFKIEKVFERDIDLYIINKFINDSSFKELFLKKIGHEKYNVYKCIHSFSDENGESDIIIILKKNDERIGLLIEDKINAIAMPEQYKRYKIRAEKQIKEGLFEHYYIFIIAPKNYLNNNNEAKKYENKISYEEILKHIRGDAFGENLLKMAIEEKKKGYSVIENKSVTLFWKKYYNLVEHEFSILKIKRHEGARGSNACWPIFTTPIKNIQIFHKSDRGYVDLTLPGLEQHRLEVNELLKNTLSETGAVLKSTGKSLAIRLIVPKIDFTSDFEEQKNNIIECLEAVVKLQDLVKKINYKEILKLKEN